MPYEEGGEDLKRIEELLGQEGASPISGGPATKDLPALNLEHDRYDGRFWRELCEASGELADLARGEGAPRTFAALLNDLFLSYFHPPSGKGRSQKFVCRILNRTPPEVREDGFCGPTRVAC